MNNLTGKTVTKIIVGKNAPSMVRYAAFELQRYLKKATGVKIPIQKTTSTEKKVNYVFVGESDYTKKLGLSLDGLASDGFKIIAEDNWLALFGRESESVYGMYSVFVPEFAYNPKLRISAYGETGTLFAVYRFLEDYVGIRWYMPGELGECIPNKKNIRIGKINYQKSPDFEYRYIFAFLFPKDDKDSSWYRRVGFGVGFPVQISHSFFLLNKHRETNPEYFTIIGGKRNFNQTYFGANLCLSEPGVLKQYVADIREYFDQNPQQYIYPVMPNDGMFTICECPKCQAQIDRSAPEEGKFSNYVWDFVNEVANEVYKTHPDKFVGCCAYEFYRDPPTNIKKLSPNVAVMICKQRAWYIDKQYKDRVNRIINAWQKKVNNIYIWEYYRFSIEGWTGFPVIYPHIISDDLRFLKGVSKGEFIEDESWEEGNYPNNCRIFSPGMQHVNLFVTAKLFWDTRLDVDKLMNEYYEKFYGPAKEEMKGFWNYAEEIWMTACPPDAQKKPDWRTPINIYTKDKLDKLSSFLEQAKIKAPDGSVYRKRIDLISAEFLPARRKLSNFLVLNPLDVTITGPSPAIKVDGILNDAAWKKATPMPFVDKEGEEARYRTLSYIAWDNDYLYLAFINYEPEISKLTTLATGPGQSAIFDDDSVEIFISPDPENRKAKCYQFLVNSRGATWDGAHTAETPGASADTKWNSNFEASTKIEGDRWIAEVKILLKSIDITAPVSGKKIAANLYRNRHCCQPVVYSCWSPTFDPSHYAPARFGQVTFKR